MASCVFICRIAERDNIAQAVIWNVKNDTHYRIGKNSSGNVATTDISGWNMSVTASSLYIYNDSAYNSHFSIAVWY